MLFSKPVQKDSSVPEQMVMNFYCKPDRILVVTENVNFKTNAILSWLCGHNPDYPATFLRLFVRA